MTMQCVPPRTEKEIEKIKDPLVNDEKFKNVFKHWKFEQYPVEAKTTLIKIVTNSSLTDNFVTNNKFFNEMRKVKYQATNGKTYELRDMKQLTFNTSCPFYGIIGKTGIQDSLTGLYFSSPSDFVTFVQKLVFFQDMRKQYNGWEHLDVVFHDGYKIAITTFANNHVPKSNKKKNKKKKGKNTSNTSNTSNTTKSESDSDIQPNTTTENPTTTTVPLTPPSNDIFFVASKDTVPGQNPIQKLDSDESFEKIDLLEIEQVPYPDQTFGMTRQTLESCRNQTIIYKKNYCKPRHENDCKGQGSALSKKEMCDIIAKLKTYFKWAPSICLMCRKLGKMNFCHNISKTCNGSNRGVNMAPLCCECNNDMKDTNIFTYCIEKYPHYAKQTIPILLQLSFFFYYGFDGNCEELLDHYDDYYDSVPDDFGGPSSKVKILIIEWIHHHKEETIFTPMREKSEKNMKLVLELKLRNELENKEIGIKYQSHIEYIQRKRAEPRMYSSEVGINKKNKEEENPKRRRIS